MAELRACRARTSRRKCTRLVHAMNEALGGRGQTYDLIEPVEADPVEQAASLHGLVARHAGGAGDDAADHRQQPGLHRTRVRRGAWPACRFA